MLINDKCFDRRCSTEFLGFSEIRNLFRITSPRPDESTETHRKLSLEHERRAGWIELAREIELKGTRVEDVKFLIIKGSERW